MDKAAYCEEMASRLRGVVALLDRLSFSPPPSTAEASKQQAERQATVSKLRALTAEAIAQVDALSADTDPAWEPAKGSLEQRWNDIAELKVEVMHASP